MAHRDSGGGAIHSINSSLCEDLTQLAASYADVGARQFRWRYRQDRLNGSLLGPGEDCRDCSRDADDELGDREPRGSVRNGHANDRRMLLPMVPSRRHAGRANSTVTW